MGFEIIARQTGRAPGQETLKNRLQSAPVDGARMIEINSGPAGNRKVRTVEIKIIQRNTGSMWEKRSSKSITQPGLS
jgi:hypothetical protein